jgi:transposase-like protein
MNARSFSRARDVLAWESSANDINARYFFIYTHPLNICKSLYIRPMLRKNLKAERIYFTLPDRLEAASPL